MKFIICVAVIFFTGSTLSAVIYDRESCYSFQDVWAEQNIKKTEMKTCIRNYVNFAELKLVAKTTNNTEIVATSVLQQICPVKENIYQCFHEYGEFIKECATPNLSLKVNVALDSFKAVMGYACKDYAHTANFLVNSVGCIKQYSLGYLPCLLPLAAKFQTVSVFTIEDCQLLRSAKICLVGKLDKYCEQTISSTYVAELFDEIERGSMCANAVSIHDD